jgi:hypothetical protein
MPPHQHQNTGQDPKDDTEAKELKREQTRIQNRESEQHANDLTNQRVSKWSLISWWKLIHDRTPNSY